MCQRFQSRPEGIVVWKRAINHAAEKRGKGTDRLSNASTVGDTPYSKIFPACATWNKIEINLSRRNVGRFIKHQGEEIDV